ncbi:threonine synthase [Campylobacter sp. CCUG 57310]|uniref:threonine synthase n=1 Tax=Campylobacter sp. CCUG 57310 TaxID=2517362 RepID=UPI0015654957|nr:threonine synthase [Campylobacter sp. CCUG 57310]QKF92406.1 threonine synthase [Campylobacter sp. CCUG 57310]
MKLHQTRANENENLNAVEFSHALLAPSSNYGGLYAPLNLPKLDDEFFAQAKELNYEQIALEIIKKFEFDVKNDVFEKALKRYLKFDKPNEPVQIRKIGENLYINELYHGPTRAFKDMALQPFGVILSELARSKNENYLIMCATSGDTGPATLETFSDAPNIKVVCLYPKDGTSEVQRLQMINASAKNLKVIGIEGNFDDAQRALKTLLASENFKTALKELGVSLSAANSVNFGRILFQIIYHVYAYVYLLKTGVLKAQESFDIIVPSGNFGNALGAYYAKKMGAKIDKIKIVSNANNILTEFFTTGVYDLRGKTLVKTISPAMDILISSNVERLLFDKFGAVRTKELMQNLSQNGLYRLNLDELEELKKDFEADFCSDEECEEIIKEQAIKDVIIDPHTATCFKMSSNLTRPTMITSTAHWVKFAPSMFKACKNEDLKDEKSGLEALAKEFSDIVPESIKSLFSSQAVHTDIAHKDEIEDKILNWIRQ